jgi:hypothetical protein
MSTFLDGSAAGVNLHLDRTPMMLRAVRDRTNGRWDALNHLSDQAAACEDITVYIMVGNPSICFVDGRDKHGRRTGGRMSIAEYRQLPDQPPEETARDNAKWAAWCEENKDRLTELHKAMSKEAP